MPALKLISSGARSCCKTSDSKCRDILGCYNDRCSGFRRSSVPSLVVGGRGGGLGNAVAKIHTNIA